MESWTQHGHWTVNCLIRDVTTLHLPCLSDLRPTTTMTHLGLFLLIATLSGFFLEILYFPFFVQEANLPESRM